MKTVEIGRRGCPLRPFSVVVVMWAMISGPGATAAGARVVPDSLRAVHQHLVQRVASTPAATPYVVIDTRDNLVQLRDRHHRLLHSAVAATGAARRFEGPKTWKQTWRFATPQGRFHILRKVADPLWIKPEWAFLEAAEEVPIFAEDPRRFQRGVLGRYALYFAKDLMIHGTLYEVNLGKSITHGCVRVGAADLRYFYDHVDVGWPVYIY